MKKVFTLLMAIIIGHVVFASSTASGNWRWRNDNGDATNVSTGTGATWKASENVAITITNATQHIRLRVVNYSRSEDHSGAPQLAYTKDPTPNASDFTVIPTGTGGAFKMIASSFVANGTSTTEQISDNTIIAASYTSDAFAGGTIYTTANGPSSNQKPTENRKYEAEFNFVPGSAITPGATYYFSLTDQNQIPGTVLSGYPSLSVAGVLPVTITDFNVVVDANGNQQITWVTATEINSASYVIESSIDGINFSPLATVASKNSATGASYAYSYTKGLPQGINYLRLKAVDKDGSSSYSSIKAINITSGTSKITIAPNPVVNTLNIAGLQTGSTVQLYNVNAQKVLTAITTGASVQQINVSNLSHGAYYVQIINAGKVIANQLIIKQ